MDNQSPQPSPEMGQQFLQACVDLGLTQDASALTKTLSKPPTRLVPVQVEGSINLQARHMELFQAYAENKQTQESLVDSLTKQHDFASDALARRTAANAAMKQLMSEQSTVDPQCFAMRHADALKEVQLARKCEASLSNLLEIGHDCLKRITQEGGGIVCQLKVLEVQLQEADPSFQLYDYGKVGTEFEDQAMV